MYVDLSQVHHSHSELHDCDHSIGMNSAEENIYIYISVHVSKIHYMVYCYCVVCARECCGGYSEGREELRVPTNADSRADEPNDLDHHDVYQPARLIVIE